MKEVRKLHNPFVHDRPLRTGAERVLCRNDSFTRGLEDTIIESMKKGDYCAVLGPPSSGKTTLGLRVRFRLKRSKPDNLILVLDGNELEHSNLPGLYHQILQQLRLQAFKRFGIKISMPPRERELSAEDLRTMLIELAPREVDRLYLCIDHIENVPFDALKDIAGCLKSIRDERIAEHPVPKRRTEPNHDVISLQKLSLLACGSLSVYKLREKSESPLSVAVLFKIRDMDERSTTDLVRQGFDLAKTYITEGALHSIYEMTEGDRYFTQKVCHMCLEVIRSGKARKMTKALVRAVLHDLIEYGERDKCLARAHALIRADPRALKSVVEICSSDEIIRRREPQTDIDTLELTGAIKIVEDHYEPRNPIYERFLSRCFDSRMIIPVFAADRFRKKRYAVEQNRSIRITIDSKNSISVETSAGVYTNCGALIDDECESLSRRTEENILSLFGSSSYDAWRKEAKDIGKSLHRRLFNAHVLSALRAIEVDLAEFQFCGGRRSLRLPFELMHDGEDYIVLNNPITRLVTGITLKKSKLQPFPRFIEGLRSSEEPLRVLIVACDGPTRLPGIQQEASELKELLQRDLRFLGLWHEVDLIPTERATYDRVVEQLESKKSYHIFHFAGHGMYDEKNSEESCIILWKDDARQETKVMPATALKTLLDSPNLRFCYFSCCEAARTQDEAALLKYDLLGVLDAAILAGVPSVIGFRWPVSDQMAKSVAIDFYKRLFSFEGPTTFSFENSLYFARRELTMAARSDPTWASPILISQYSVPTAHLS